jgi:hypothetical protein
VSGDNARQGKPPKDSRIEQAQHSLGHSEVKSPNREAKSSLGPESQRAEPLMGDLEPPPSREYAATLISWRVAGGVCAIRAWMAGDVDEGMLLIGQHHVPEEAAVFVLSLVKAVCRALLSAEGYQAERALTVLDQWMEDAAERAAAP